MVENSTDKNIFFKVVLVIGFLIIIARLFELQVVKGKYYRQLSDGNRIRKVTIVAPRGIIFARGGEVIAGNSESPKEVVFEKNLGYIKKSISDTEKGPSSIIEYKRTYPLDSKVSHIIGYIGKVADEELGKVDGSCIDKGVRDSEDWLGRAGLEQNYDCVLRGIDGSELIEVESSGEKVRILGVRDPIEGEDLKTTLHLPLQEFISELLDNQKGVIIASDGYGEMLAMYSSPSYDSSAMVRGDSQAVEDIFSDTNLPLLNRSIGGTYAPGSIYKPIVSIAALEEGIITKDWKYEDTGKIYFKTLYGEYTYNNWFYTQHGGTEGSINVEKAIARSTDTFFYKVGEELGVEKLHDWTLRFGLGGVTGIDLPGEVGGLVPDPKWKEVAKGERWFLGNTYHMAIGQGDLLVTPIQMNIATAVIANGGELCEPHFVGGKKCTDLKLDPKNLQVVISGMEDACSTGGTGYTFFDFELKFDVKVACKTGTAEVGSDDDTHAWFSAFAPAENPEIVLTVLIEKGGEGSKVAGPIARKIFDYWFKDKLKEEYKITPTPTP